MTAGRRAVLRHGPPRWILPLVRNFGGPRGLLGRVALSMMARRNGEKNAWVVEQLDLGPGDAYLDVGCGPGLALASARRHVGDDGRVVGVDASAASVRASRRRVPDVEVRQAPAASLPFDDGAFDAATAVNTIGFWPDAEAGLREVRRVLRPGGRLAVALRVYDPDAGRLDPASFGATDDDLADVRNLLRHVGFDVVDTRTATHRETRRETTAAILVTRR